MATRVLYSFPNKLGAGRICWTAYQQVLGTVRAGAKVTVFTASVNPGREVPAKTVTTLSIKGRRLPARLLGSRRMAMIHDWITARWLDRNHSQIDVIHAWPLGSLETSKVAARHGIPLVLERPNAHTGFAYQVVEEECERLGIELPEGFEHKFDSKVLAREEKEYSAASFLLCPSEFVARTFRDRGFPEEKFLRHRYGYEFMESAPSQLPADSARPLVAMFAGLCTPRKGLHHALQAWLDSGAQEKGRFLICGDFVPGFREKLQSLLAHPSIEILGHRTDVQKIMSTADVFVLPSIEEGSALVTYEARGAGCVLAVSEASGAVCEHGVNGLVHQTGNVAQLASHIASLDRDRNLLASLRANSLSTADELTWTAAGHVLLNAYELAIAKAGTSRGAAAVSTKA